MLHGLKLLTSSIIEAEVVLPSGQVVLRKHNLDVDLGNDHGTFTFGDMRFSSSARNVYLRDATLYAELARPDGIWYPDKIGLEVDIPDSHQNLEDIAVRVVEYHARHSPSLSNDRARLCVTGNEDL